MSTACANLVFLALVASPLAQGPPPANPKYTFATLTAMGWYELEAVFRSAPLGEMPAGFVRGWTIYNPKDPMAKSKTRIANSVWKGKHFFPETSSLINQFAGFRAIRGETYQADSQLDGKRAHILDYANTSVVWGTGFDEMRQVGPRLYVGGMLIRDCPQPWLKTLFVLEVCSPCCNPTPSAAPAAP